MEVGNCIKKRRSIRSYLDKDVKWEKIGKLLDAAHWAPSSGNIQNWRFIVVKDKGVREKIAKACLDQTWMIQAPIHIVICSEKENIKGLYNKRGEKYSIQNCAAAIENLLLKGCELGLGSCWVGAFNDMGLKRAVNVPDNIEIEAVVTIGYAAEKPVSKRHKVEEVTFFEGYGNRKRDVSLFPLGKHKKEIEKAVSRIKKKIKK